ncbi:hypothetical protein chiPu_0002710 [Chiloscyllium punctatum]|uniref:Uncharacterized protein n=1 Tax=Chiloscyllium punctatum TaxID=137246 RepID=A0A401S1S8_CHIPU|nr:hypothetical protein [Chiloscyllium punctatum]
MAGTAAPEQASVNDTCAAAKSPSISIQGPGYAYSSPPPPPSNTHGATVATDEGVGIFSVPGQPTQCPFAPNQHFSKAESLRAR